MALLDILIYPDPRLREKCKPVTEITPEIKKILADMAETMYAAPGIGLAASQVGVMQRLIVVDIGDREHDEGEGASAPHTEARLYKLVNPVIISRSGKSEGEEGCLSLPNLKETIKRSERVVVEGLDENGKAVRIEAGGLLSVCLQHEIDHLDGILIIDHLSRLKREMLKSKLKRLAAGES